MGQKFFDGVQNVHTCISFIEIVKFMIQDKLSNKLHVDKTNDKILYMYFG